MKSLLFNETMMKAWLAGNKTVTRRRMKPQPIECKIDLLKEPDVYGWSVRYPDHGYFSGGLPLDYILRKMKAPYRPGETIYIKEKWRICGGVDDGDELSVEYFDGQKQFTVIDDDLIYDRYAGQKNPYRWRSSMMMPEWSSRSHAKVISVRPERIQDITEEEAIKEGFGHQESYMVAVYERTGSYAIAQFAKTWGDIYGIDSFEKNDRVWRIELMKEKEGK